jgi:predicted AlkP superfamily pyrophosphatase or phosphodiesterase
MDVKIFFIFLLISSIDSAPIITNQSSPPLLLLISFDGFRWDYPDIYKLPNFDSIFKRGVRVKHIDNSFATVTFPSHFTMVTGLYEETHGIVANEIYDRTLKDFANKNTMNDTKWWYVISKYYKFSFVGYITLVVYF